MKKLPFVMLTLLVLAACNNNGSITPSSSSIRPSTSITTSSSSTSSSSETNDERYAIYVKAQAAGFTGTYEEWLDSIKGADGTSLLNGTTNPTSTLGKNGDTYINTSTWDVYVKSGGDWTKVGNILGTKGADGLTPHIGNNGNWWIGTTDTNVPATGPAGSNGTNGTNGQTPHIGNNGNWWIGETDTGVKAALTINTLTVTFKPENGQANFTQQVNQYHLVTKPTNPTKADHQFIGWFTDLDEQWVFSGYPLTQNLTLTAKYQVVENGTDGLLFTPTIYEGKQSYVVSGYEGTSKDVIIPSTFNNIDVVGVGTMAFNNKSINSVVFSDKIKLIGGSAFSNNQLTSVIIPNSVTTIGEGAFASNQLTSVTIPNSVTTIGEGAFEVNQLTSVIIPNSVTTIGGMAFYENQLTSVTIPNSVTTIGGSAFYNNQLSSVSIPNSVTTIGDYAFTGNQITSLTIPNSVMSIGQFAFAANLFTTLIVPINVTTIGEGAFSSFLAKTIYVEAAVKPTGWNQSWNYSPTPITIIWDYKNQ
jgi:uncharacterized repeat protein (TIGR02543 family)